MRGDRPDWLIGIDFSASTFAQHLEHPDQTVDAYIKSRHLELGAEVVRRKRIYLDQRYWIYCREAALGRPQSPEHHRLYEALRNGVQSGQIICPTNLVILRETMKHAEHNVRLQSAEVIQELSGGVSIHPSHVLDQLEVLHFLRSAGTKSQDIYPTEQLAWCKVGNIIGHPSPMNLPVDPATDTAIRKSWYDFMAGIPLSTLVSAFSAEGIMQGQPSDDCYVRRNAECQQHRGDFQTFSQVYLIEIGGILDSMRTELDEAQLYLYEKQTGRSRSEVKSSDVSDGTRQLIDLIHHGFQTNVFTTQLAGIQILASIHAAIRHKGQKFRRGDREDHQHARAALPYCDLFLTERTLGGLLTTNPLNLDKRFACQVRWDIRDSVTAVEALLSSVPA